MTKSIKQVNTASYAVTMTETNRAYEVVTINYRTGHTSATAPIKDFDMASYIFDIAIEELESK